MSLNENIDMVKEELNSEEKFFEKAVLTERFMKKYKKLLIGSVVAVVVLVGVNVAVDISNQNRIEGANKLFMELQSGKQDEAVKAELKSLSPNLYNAWLYSTSLKNKDKKGLKEVAKSSTFIVNDMAEYEAIELDPKSETLDAYAKKSDAIYKDIATIESAVLLLKANKIDEAHIKLSSIGVDSKMYDVATSLMHYGLK